MEISNIQRERTLGTENENEYPEYDFLLSFAFSSKSFTNEYTLTEAFYSFSRHINYMLNENKFD